MLLSESVEMVGWFVWLKMLFSLEMMCTGFEVQSDLAITVVFEPSQTDDL